MFDPKKSTLFRLIIKLQIIWIFVLILQSCTHTISLVNKEYDGINVNLANKNIAFILLTDDLNKLYQPEKSGGGGESVEYYPYRDLKSSIESVPMYQVGRISFYTSLSLVDTSSFDYVIDLTISTDEEWNWLYKYPVEFFISLNCIMANMELGTRHNFKVIGKGETDSFLAQNFDSAYRMAMKNTIQNLIARISHIINVNNIENK